MKEKVKAFINDERGDFSVKGLAIMVGAVVVIGFVVAWLTTGGQLQTWVNTVWEAVWGWIQNFIK